MIVIYVDSCGIVWNFIESTTIQELSLTQFICISIHTHYRPGVRIRILLSGGYGSTGKWKDLEFTKWEIHWQRFWQYVSGIGQA